MSDASGASFDSIDLFFSSRASLSSWLAVIAAKFLIMTDWRSLPPSSESSSLLLRGRPSLSLSFPVLLPLFGVGLLPLSGLELELLDLEGLGLGSLLTGRSDLDLDLDLDRDRDLFLGGLRLRLRPWPRLLDLALGFLSPRPRSLFSRPLFRFMQSLNPSDPSSPPSLSPPPSGLSFGSFAARLATIFLGSSLSLTSLAAA